MEERTAIQKFENQEIRANIVDLANVWVVQRCDGSGFPPKSFRVLLGRNLQSNDPIEARIARFVHYAHTSSADLRENFVRPESVASRQQRRLVTHFSFRDRL